MEPNYARTIDLPCLVKFFPPAFLCMEDQVGKSNKLSSTMEAFFGMEIPAGQENKKPTMEKSSILHLSQIAPPRKRHRQGYPLRHD